MRTARSVYIDAVLDLGAQFAGYRIDRVLGHGRTSTCYEATHALLLRTVALKVIDPELSAHEGFHQEFRRAKLGQTTLEHPHLVATFEAGLRDDLLFVAMQLVKGSTLDNLVNAGDLDDRRLLRSLAQVAGALDAIHAQEMVHGGMRPSTVFVTPQGHSFLGDLALPEVPAGGRLTPIGAYMAPEVRAGAPAGPAADVYALGAVMYDALAGTLAEEECSPAACADRDRWRRAPLSERRPDLPEALGGVCATALAESPYARQRSAGELMREVHYALTDTDALPPPLGVGGISPRGAGPRLSSGSTPAATGAGLQRRDGFSPPHRPRPRVRARMTITALAAVLGIIAGFVLQDRLAGRSDSEVRAASARAGTLGISYPESWIRMEPPRIPGLRLTNPVSLRTPAALGVHYVIGAADNAHGIKLLPGALRALVVGHLRGQAVEIAGETQALRYRGVRVRGVDAPLTFYAVPVAGGAVIAACQAAAPSARSILAACDRASAAIGITRVRTFALGPDGDYGKRLRDVVGALDSTVGGLLARLEEARTRAGQASVAADLSNAYDRAARGLSGAVVSGRDEPGHRSILAAFEETASGYARLARAARAGRSARYRTAQRALRSSETRTQAALAELGRLGYTA